MSLDFLDDIALFKLNKATRASRRLRRLTRPRYAQPWPLRQRFALATFPAPTQLSFPIIDTFNLKVFTCINRSLCLVSLCQKLLFIQHGFTVFIIRTIRDRQGGGKHSEASNESPDYPINPAKGRHWRLQFGAVESAGGERNTSKNAR